MNQNASLSIVCEIMTDFASQTGLTTAGKVPRRYLWTDAFAVCNFLELNRQTNEEKYKQLALELVDQVHNILGRHRDEDVRAGWLSGLDEQEGKRHPTMGGLRIGKALAECGPSDSFDENLEWDRDGQYYHYLSKWMHALNRVSRVTADFTYNKWAIELAKTAHTRFTYVPSFGGKKSMYWKMSIDLSRPLVPSMGQHDPLDGFITYHELQLYAADDAETSFGLDLKEEISDMANICKGKSWVTDDPLGIGGLLCDAYRVAQLMANRDFAQTDLLATLLDASLVGLKNFTRSNSLTFPVDYRLAFRELGLSIGLHAIEKLRGVVLEKPDRFQKSLPSHQCIERLMQYTPLIESIEQFWLVPSNRDAKSWTDHRDINMVMLATSLAPGGFLAL